MASKTTSKTRSSKRPAVAKTKTPSKKSTALTWFNFSEKARLTIFMLLFANIATIGLLIAQAATAGLSYSRESDQVTRINSYRGSNGRAGLTRSSCLSGIARSWSIRMGQVGKLAHSSDTGSGYYSSGFDYGKQVPAQCGGAWKLLGENVGVGYDSPSLFNAFTASAPHKANIINSSFTHVGVGAYISADGRLWVTQIFAACPGCGTAYSKAPRSVGEPGSNLRDTLTGGEKLTSGQSISSVNGSYSLNMQSDGNLVIYRHWGGSIWNSRSAGSSNAYAIFQTDGNFVIYRTGKSPCHSGTGGRGGKRISLGGDGNLVIYNGTGGAVWASKGSTWYCS